MTEWQNLQVGDPVKLCAGDFAPPPYIVAQLHPNQAIVLGHQENGEWVDLWQFVLVPQPDGATRLIVRTRTHDGPAASGTSSIPASSSWRREC